MSLKSRAAWHFMAGLMAGSTLAYLLAVLLGLLMPSWPFNAFFTPLAALGLALQAPYLWRPVEPCGARWCQGASLGAAVLALVWLFYCYGWPT
ncbi:hypothetical protein ACSX1C_17845 [Pseudomonas sp. MBLB4123]|uniref:hypothetical protein n=1 Tax=Pseudomonas sp. MBLB4123 TaxID=3451557 RepID=UPI003F74F765